MKKVEGKVYDKTDFFWAVMYGKQITVIYPRGNDARKDVFHNNRTWEKNGWGTPWHVKRFRYHFKGSDIDAFEHEWHRTEKKK